MAISPEREAELREIQERLRQTDPAILELDPSNEEDAAVIILAGFFAETLANGNTLSITLGEEDRTETIEIQPMGTDSDGKPMTATIFRISDGKLSPETSEAIARLTAAPEG